VAQLRLPPRLGKAVDFHGWRTVDSSRMRMVVPYFPRTDAASRRVTEVVAASTGGMDDPGGGDLPDPQPTPQAARSRHLAAAVCRELAKISPGERP
jgi:hypothetical protein